MQEPLGDGLPGDVWKVIRKGEYFPRVVKLHHFLPAWRREVSCYKRLLELRTQRILGFNIPRFLGADEHWRSLEMSLVSPPYLLDFGTAWLDVRPEFPPGVWEETEAAAAENFGARWDQACEVIHTLEVETGIIMGDVHPGNLAFS